MCEVRGICEDEILTCIILNKGLYILILKRGVCGLLKIRNITTSDNSATPSSLILQDLGGQM
jgi:hypothetical protein